MLLVKLFVLCLLENVYGKFENLFICTIKVMIFKNSQGRLKLLKHASSDEDTGV